MAASSRRKGIRGEAEVAAILRAGGLEPRGLESSGDWLCVRIDGKPAHIEVKRAERLKLPEWIRQAEAEAPPGALVVVAYRQSREPWRAVLLLSELVELLAR